MLKIEIKLTRNDVYDTLKGLQNALRDTTPLMQELAGTMSDAVSEAFEQERDPVTGAAWPRLNAAYRRQRAEDGHDGKILQLSGSLATSIIQQAGHGYARVGTNNTYAAIHQFGGITRCHWIRPKDKKALAFYGKGGGKKIVRRGVFHPGSEIPRRRFLGVGPEHKTHMEERILDYLYRYCAGKR